MANTIEINNKTVSVVGQSVGPRYVWIMDGLGRQIVADPAKFGIDERDLVVSFPSGRFADMEEFLRQKSGEIGAAQAVVFLLVGADEIAEDAPPVLSYAITHYWLHPRGPRQIPLHSAAEVTAKYEAMVDLTLQLLPSARVYTSDPAPRRSGHGFAVKRAMRVSDEIKQRDVKKHSHIRLIRKFHSKRPAGGRNVFKEGGKYPLREMFFEDDGMTMIPTALIGVFVRARMYVETMVGGEGQLVSPDAIDGLKVKF